MSGVELVALVIGLGYAAANIGLLCSIKYDLGRGSQKMEDHGRRIEKLERKTA